MSCHQFFWCWISGQCFCSLIWGMLQLFLMSFLSLFMPKKVSLINHLFSLKLFLFYFFCHTNFSLWRNLIQMTLKLTTFYLFMSCLMSNLIIWFFGFDQLLGILADGIKFFYGSFMIHTVKVLIVSLRLMMPLVYFSFRQRMSRFFLLLLFLFLNRFLFFIYDSLFFEFRWGNYVGYRFFSFHLRLYILKMFFINDLVLGLFSLNRFWIDHFLFFRQFKSINADCYVFIYLFKNMAQFLSNL